MIQTRRIRAAAIPLALAALLVCAWVLKTQAMTGEVVAINTANSMNFFIGNNPDTPLYRTWWLGSHGPGEPGVPARYTALVHRIRDNPPGVQDQMFRQLTLDYIRARPDLFIIRTLSRIRSYFAFDVFFGAEVYQGYHMSRTAGLALIAGDAICYVLVMVCALIYLLDCRRSAVQSRIAALILLTALAYAIPYWLSFAHPTYHMPVLPLFGIFAATYIARLVELRAASGVVGVAPVRRRARLSKVTWLALAVLLYIQAEWVYIVFLGK